MRARDLRRSAGNELRDDLGKVLGLVLGDGGLLGRNLARAVAAGNGAGTVRATTDNLGLKADMRQRESIGW